LLFAACSDGQPTDLAGVQAIAYIQRSAADTGNVFDYTRDSADTDQSNIYILSPPSASGKRVNITNFGAGSDIMAMDLSFDATEIVFSARRTSDDNYHLYLINVDGTNPVMMGQAGPQQITGGPYDDTYPVFTPGGRIFFMTNENVEGQSVKQFRDEYERATTAQVASISRAGGDRQLGARNVSHRVSPALMSDGRVIMTQWDHLGEKNEGNLVIMNQDLTGQREGFGKENKGITNAYLRVKEVQPGQMVAIGTSRDRTFQSGKIVLINLGTVGADGKVDMSTLSEANSSAIDLTPDVPGDRTPSYQGVGRYYEAVPIGDPSDRKFVVSWSDGPVETDTLGKSASMPSFSLYLFDGKLNTRFPIAAAENAWISSPLPIQQRAEPPMLNSASVAAGTQSTLISAINVYDSSLFQITPGTVKKVRIMEGFSDEEGVPGMFGLTEFDGHARLGEIDLGGDGVSFKAVVPANVPIHIQLLDQFGMAQQTEPIWIQGRAGEARVCGGCHEDRTKTPQVTPGSSALQALGASALDLPRAQRSSMDFSPAKVMGVPWDKALQPIFDAHCIDCHDGTPGAANPTYTINDVTDAQTFTYTFDLTSKASALNTAGGQMYGFTMSHLSLMGPAMTFEEKQVTFGNGVMPPAHIEPGSARDSDLIKMLNPPQYFPSLNTSMHAFGDAPQHPAEQTALYNMHDPKDPKYQLTPDEIYLLILSADMGGQFYSRENAPGGNY
jgi:hypothetical protein